MSPGYPYLVFQMLIKCLECKFPKGKLPYQSFIKFTLLTHSFSSQLTQILTKLVRSCSYMVTELNLIFLRLQNILFSQGTAIVPCCKVLCSLLRSVGIILNSAQSAQDYYFIVFLTLGYTPFLHILSQNNKYIQWSFIIG